MGVLERQAQAGVFRGQGYEILRCFAAVQWVKSLTSSMSVKSSIGEGSNPKWR